MCLCSHVENCVCASMCVCSTTVYYCDFWCINKWRFLWQQDWFRIFAGVRQSNFIKELHYLMLTKRVILSLREPVIFTRLVLFFCWNTISTVLHSERKVLCENIRYIYYNTQYMKYMWNELLFHNTILNYFISTIWNKLLLFKRQENGHT